MKNPQLSRRVVLKTIGLSLILAGCRDNASLNNSQLSPTPTATPDAQVVAQAYLHAWQLSDYNRMYDLLTIDSRIILRSGDRLRRQYLSILTEATVQTAETRVQSLLYNDYQAIAAFRVNWQTALFGTMQTDNQMRLRYTPADGWGVEWQPTLILPQLGEGISLAFLSEQPTRGTIYDRQQHAIASLGQLITIGVVPQQLENIPATVHHLATMTGEPPEEIEAKINESQPDWYVPIATIDFETSLKFDDLLNTIPGVQRRVAQQRVYNDGTIGSHLIGYMGPISEDERTSYQRAGYRGDELVGLMGIERWAERYLAGQRGGRLVTVSPTQNILSDVAEATAQAGQNVHLTIDTVFQSTVEQLLGERIGSIVVMNPTSGEIYALANYPRFTPAVITPGFDIADWLSRYTDDSRPLINRATQGLYPPASIFKVVTMAAALESLGMSPEETFICPGVWTGLGEQFAKKCWLESGHGAITLFDGLTQSCDTVFYEVGLALHRQDPNLLPTWARYFGLGNATHIELTENPGVVPDDAWKQAVLGDPFFDGDAVNSAIGQGYVLSTPLQIARLTAALANGGQLVQPHVASHYNSPSGQPQYFEHDANTPLPLSADNLNLIRRSLAEVTSGAQGTARKAFAGFSQSVAGKTGTAETGIDDPHSWFSGYSPVESPEVVITVLLENAGEGSTEAAPLFRQIADAFFAWKQTQETDK